MLQRIARLMTLTASTAMLLSSQAFAADAVVQQDTNPAPGTFDESRLYVSAFAGANFIDDVVLRGLVNVGGDFSSTNLFVNALFDLPELGTDLITPYAGAGIGVAFTDLNAIYGPGVVLDSSDENFAAQAIIGATVRATED